MISTKTVIAAALVACLAVLSAHCGSSRSTTAPSAQSQTVTLDSEAALDGWVTAAGEAVAAGGGPFTGDDDPRNNGLGFRQVYSFNLSSVPRGAHITSATLQLYQALVKGQPYSVLGNVVVDHVNLDGALDSSDYDGGSLERNIGTLSTNATIEVKRLEVTSAVQGDVTAARAHAQFRLRTSLRDSNSDGNWDFVQFTDAEDSCCRVSRPPQLVVVYTPQ
jgi:hypothetical protein